MKRLTLRRVSAIGLIVIACGPKLTLAAAAPAMAQAQAAASLSGTATSSAGQTLANTVVQLRNLATGQLTGTTASNAVGQFSFVGLNPGNYAVEIVNAAGQVVATSASVTVAAGAAITGVTVGATAAVAAAAAAGAAAAGAAAAGTAISTSVIVAAAAAAAGVTGLAVIAASPSPSR